MPDELAAGREPQNVTSPLRPRVLFFLAVTWPLLPLLPPGPLYASLSWREAFLLLAAAIGMVTVWRFDAERHLVLRRWRATGLSGLVVALIAIVFTSGTLALLKTSFPSRAAATFDWFRWLVQQRASFSMIDEASPLNVLPATIVIVAGPLFFLLIVGFIRGRVAARILVRGAVITASVVAGMAVAQSVFRIALLERWVREAPLIPRANVTFSDPNALGSYLALMLPITVAGIGCAADGRRRLGWSMLAAIQAAGIVSSGSRAAIGGAAVAVLVFTGLALIAAVRFDWGTKRRRKTLITTCVGSFLVVGVGFLSIVAFATVTDAQFTQESSPVGLLLWTANLNNSADVVFKGRAPHLMGAVYMAAEHPLWGVGIGRSYALSGEYAGRYSGVRERLENAHNYVVQMAAELGLPGALVWVGIILLAIYRPATVALKSSAENRALSMSLLGIACGLLAFALTLMAGNTLLLAEGQFAFWGTLAMASVSILGHDDASVAA